MVDQLVDVCSIEWAGNEALVYTQISAQGQPAKVGCHLHFACIAPFA